MTNRAKILSGVCAILLSSLPAFLAQGQSHETLSEPLLIMRLHAEGAQLYECKLVESDTLEWRLREPIAVLLRNGRTVGRHYAGPNWELDDGSSVVARVAARAPGATREDVPLLWLEVETRRGHGRLSEAATIERANTKGGAASGACGTIGAILSVPYSADYAFMRRPD